MPQNKKIHTFTDLVVWQEGHTLVLGIYSITKTFPKYEAYSLTDQMRRAATPITSNIAEGFGRHSFKEKLQFYYLAHGSMTELKNQLLIARDVGYITDTQYEHIAQQADQTHRILQGLLIKTKDIIRTSAS